nr:translation initiation factor IF-2 N-terminal domain-containing protein [Nitratireductor sp.]
MSENETDDKKLSVTPKKTLTLRPGGLSQGTVRQNFSHGRSKAVVVETRKRRITKPGEKPAEPVEAAVQPEAREAAPAPAPAPQRPVFDASQHPNLSPSELEARRKALEEANAREMEDRARREEESRRRAEETARAMAEREAAEQRAREEAAAKEARAAEPAARRKEEEAPRKAPATAEARPAARDEKPGATPLKPFERKRVEEPDKPAKPKTGDDRRRTKLTLVNALDEDGNVRGPSLAAMRRRQEKARRAAMQGGPREKIAREVVLPETITIQELAQRMSERSVDVIKFLMKQGQMMKPGDVIDADMAELIAGEFGHQVKRVAESDVETGLFDQKDKEEELLPRPPVVTIMGHVDHGMSSLLDAIRNANVVEGEAGGITQHIGAYQVEKNGSRITFIDTPGHEAFTSMRARGAQATDIAILVVAADDGVMPQTIESINHAKAAGVPIIVAINKIDKPAADPNRVRTALLQHEIFVESMGGEVLDVEVSAKTGAGIDKLLETILLQAEVMELRANPDRPAEGVVIEAQLDKGRGP